MRSWLTANFGGNREGQQFIDLWTSASAVGFRLAPLEGNLPAANTALATDDSMELNLRRLAAFICLRRTGDAAGSMHMLAVKPPGAGADVAPTWLVEESTTHSKMEHQRGERIRAA